MRRSRRIGAGAAVVIAAAGSGIAWLAATRPDGAPHPAAPAASATVPAARPGPAGTSPSPPPSEAALGDGRRPVRIVIDRLGVTAPVGPVGLRRDGTVQVPPLSRVHEVGWYRYGPAPGERGPAVLLGHVDSGRGGPGVFYRLGTLRPGDGVRVIRADGRAVRFRITSVEEVPKARFPTARVYGDLDHAGLRLITCGGPFDRARRSYTRNVIAWARPTGSQPSAGMTGR
ncbi:class F sortase [Spirillospora sp. NPDC048911]|uniref:class F sortase n=1 Tax=Spirillospora sp. NPDC048911 TaxID=3364527 RepID=UPI00371914A7